MSEQRRINFIINRDGIEAAKQFAYRTYKLYRKAVVVDKKFAHRSPYREGYIKSYLELKKFCEGK